MHMMMNIFWRKKTSTAQRYPIFPISDRRDEINETKTKHILHNNVHGVNMGPHWGRQDSCGPMLAPWTLLSGLLAPMCQTLSSGQLWRYHVPIQTLKVYCRKKITTLGGATEMKSIVMSLHSKSLISLLSICMYLIRFCRRDVYM